VAALERAFVVRVSAIMEGWSAMFAFRWIRDVGTAPPAAA
jgi:hypothetical protein